MSLPRASIQASPFVPLTTLYGTRLASSRTFVEAAADEALRPSRPCFRGLVTA